MDIEQTIWVEAREWQPCSPGRLKDAHLVLLFGSTGVIEAGEWRGAVRDAYPRAHLIGCSTAGEIGGTRIYDDSLVATAIRLEHTRVSVADVNVQLLSGSYEAGSRLARALDHNGLAHVLVLSDGQLVNGSRLVLGLLENLPSGVSVTGGMAGDGDRFERTLVFADGDPAEGTIVAVGFYGDKLRVGYGSLGGWDAFGPKRIITRSDGNTLYELDGKPALELYKTYLGEHAAGLPATGLHFPLSIQRKDGEESLVRTILAVDEAAQSLTFAGDIPEGSTAQLMKANFERLIDGAEEAARMSFETAGEAPPELALLISCVGRKLMLRQRTEEEIEGAASVFGDKAVLTGFYSYGEICPGTTSTACELHNQTMTITTFSEIP